MDLLEALICFSSKGMHLIIFKIILKCFVNIREARQNGAKHEMFHLRRLPLAD